MTLFGWRLPVSKPVLLKLKLILMHGKSRTKRIKPLKPLSPEVSSFLISSLLIQKSKNSHLLTLTTNRNKPKISLLVRSSKHSQPILQVFQNYNWRSAGSSFFIFTWIQPFFRKCLRESLRSSILNSLGCDFKTKSFDLAFSRPPSF